MSNSDGSGSIDRDEFLQIPQIQNNPLAGRMIAIFDEEYVTISAFSFVILVLTKSVLRCSLFFFSLSAYMRVWTNDYPFLVLIPTKMKRM